MSIAVQSLFGRIAGRYDLVNRALSLGQDVRWRRIALGMLPSNNERVLDLATGTGDLGADALALGRANRVHGADFCVPMLKAGNRRRQPLAFSATAGDGLHLPFADGSFDAAIMAYGWRNFDDQAAGLRELWRVLRPQGSLLLLEFFRPETLWTRTFTRGFGVMAPVVGALLAGDGGAYAYLQRSIAGFLSVTEAEAMISQCGFGDQQWRSFFGGVSHAVVCRRP